MTAAAGTLTTLPRYSQLTYCGTTTIVVSEGAGGHAKRRLLLSGGGRGRGDDSEVSLQLRQRAGSQRVSQYNSERAIRLFVQTATGIIQIDSSGVVTRRRKECIIVYPSIRPSVASVSECECPRGFCNLATVLLLLLLNWICLFFRRPSSLHLSRGHADRTSGQCAIGPQQPMTTTEDGGNDGNGVGVSTGGNGVVVGNGVNGGVIMENLIEKSLYDIGDPDLMDVWDTDLNAVSEEGRTSVRTSASANGNFRMNLRKLTV